jgi:hypothetical protein
MYRSFLFLTFAGALVCAGEEFELGGAAGYAFSRNASISGGPAPAEAGFKSGFLFSAFGGHRMHRVLSGEVRYTYRDNDLTVSSGGTEVTGPGKAHLVHYDFLLHSGAERPRILPFVAFGGGIKIFRGTGDEPETQPLSQYAILTRTDELLPMLSLGGGVRFRIGNHASIRFDFRDYVTPFPTKVILPAPGMRAGSWVHDLTGMIGISAMF